MASVQKDPKTSGHSDTQAPTSGMWRNTNTEINGSAPLNGAKK